MPTSLKLKTILMIEQADLNGLDCETMQEFFDTYIINAWNGGQKHQAKQKIRKLSDDQKLEFNDYIDDSDLENKTEWKNRLIQCILNPHF